MTVIEGHDDDADAGPPEDPDRTKRFATLMVLGTDLIAITASSSPAPIAVVTGAALLGWLVHCWSELRK